MTDNPFTERGRIVDAARFAGRWAELSLLFERLEARRPVFVFGGPGIGKSSLLTHVMQSAALNMERFDLRAFFLDIAEAESAAEIYRVVAEALGQRGATQAALEVALAAADGPVLLCLDNADEAIAAGWGEQLLDDLARIARGGNLLLVATLDGPPPVLSERVAAVRLGAFAPPEIRLMVEAYLEGTGVVFTPAELRALGQLSAGHPAYLQRAAFFLFASKRDPSLSWRAAYLAEARERPVPGAPLPPGVFAAGDRQIAQESAYIDDDTGEAATAGPPAFELVAPGGALAAGVPILAGLLLLALTGSLAIGVAAALLGLVALAALRRR